MADEPISPKNPPRKRDLPPTVLGAVSELLACSFLVMQGYEVFRNVCPSGSTDIIAIRGEELKRFDVKRTVIEKNGKPRSHIRAKTQKQIDNGVEIICVDPAGNCYMEEYWKGTSSYKRRHSAKKPRRYEIEKTIEPRVCEWCLLSFTPYLNRGITKYCKPSCKKNAELKAGKERRRIAKAERQAAKKASEPKPIKEWEFKNGVILINDVV